MRRRVLLLSEQAPAVDVAGCGAGAQVRVEVRVIFPPGPTNIPVAEKLLVEVSNQAMRELAVRKLTSGDRILTAEQVAGIDRWITDTAYAPDDFVLGDQGLAGAQLPDLWSLLDLVRPDWRALLAALDGES